MNLKPPAHTFRCKGGIAHEKEKRPVHDIQRLCDLAHIADHEASTDVLGSYTGTGANGDSPVQDADDL